MPDNALDGVGGMDDQGNLIRWLGTNTDIDDVKKDQRELSESLESRDAFISVASHELKTPITSLKLQLQMLNRKINMNEDLKIVADKNS